MTNAARLDGTAEHDASMEAMARHLYGDGDMDEERERIALAVATLDGADVQQGAVKVRCCDCQVPYGDEFGFPDLVVPHEAWSQISPNGDEGGLLCPNCMVRRAHRAGVRCVATFRSGPFARIEGPPATDTITPDRTAELLPCPFCGGEATLKDYTNAPRAGWLLQHRCPILGPIFFEGSEGPSLAAQWNTRQQQDRIAALEAEQRARAMDLLLAYGETEEALNEMARLTAELDEAQSERMEQAILLGMGAEREMSLLAKIARLTAERNAAEERGAKRMQERAAAVVLADASKMDDAALKYGERELSFSADASRE